MNSHDKKQFQKETKKLSPEWIALVKEAMRSGVSKEEFQEFLNRRQQQINHGSKDC